MKLFNITKVIIILNLIFCIPGTQRDACRYNAQPKKNICEGVLGMSLAAQGDRKILATNLALVECLKYYSTIEDCKKEENRYIPSIYGMLKINKLEEKMTQIPLGLAYRIRS